MTTYAGMTSEELMSLVASGDRQAFACLMRRHLDTVHGIAGRFFRTRQEAEDVVQEVFVRVWRHAGRYRPEARFSTWLYTVAANCCRSSLSSFWRRNVLLIGSFRDDAEDAVRQSAPSTEDVVSEGRMARLVREAVLSLPERQRLALILRHFEGLSYAEIAEIMGCGAASVESLLFRARDGLKRRLAGEISGNAASQADAGAP